MSAQVIFLPLKFIPTHEEYVKLDEAQRDIELWQAELAYLSRDFTEFSKFIFKENAHNSTREKWLLITNQEIHRLE